MGSDVEIVPPFCDYGTNIFIGSRVFLNRAVWSSIVPEWRSGTTCRSDPASTCRPQPTRWTPRCAAGRSNEPLR